MKKVLFFLVIFFFSVSFISAETLVNFNVINILAVPFDQREDMNKYDQERINNLVMLEASLKKPLTKKLEVEFILNPYIVQEGLIGINFKPILSLYGFEGLRFGLASEWKLAEPGCSSFYWVPKISLLVSYKKGDFKISSSVNLAEEQFGGFFTYHIGKETYLKSFVKFPFTKLEIPIYDSYGVITDWGNSGFTPEIGFKVIKSNLIIGAEIQPDYWANLEGNPMYTLKVCVGYSFSKEL
ncbi:hypothetical protein K9M42_01430 [Patescibacteria group bacterium]|nr:hypothetical protein [Patescibacteria group bacterium]